jgi:influenza virus NS1A-binding protein
VNGVNGESKIASYRLNGYINKIGLQFLVEYAYTGLLEVPDDMVIKKLLDSFAELYFYFYYLLLSKKVKDVYLAAWQLRMDRVVTECARHLIAELSFDTCIDIRSLPGINKNKNFVQEVDAFIFKEVSEKKMLQFYGFYPFLGRGIFQIWFAIL